MSVFNKLAGKTATTPRTATANSVENHSFLTSILKKAKNDLLDPTAMVSTAGVRPESDRIWDPGGGPTCAVHLNQHLTSLLVIVMSDVDIDPNLLVQGVK